MFFVTRPTCFVTPQVLQTYMFFCFASFWSGACIFLVTRPLFLNENHLWGSLIQARDNSNRRALLDKRRTEMLLAVCTPSVHHLDGADTCVSDGGILGPKRTPKGYSGVKENGNGAENPRECNF